MTEHIEPQIPTNVRSEGDRLAGLGLNQHPPATSVATVRWRELLAVIAVIVLADLTIFRASGYAGGALFLVVAPVLLLIASPAPRLSSILGGIGVMLWILAARLVWQGVAVSGLAGLILITAFAMSLAGRIPYILELTGFAFKAWVDAVGAIRSYDKWLRQQFRYFPNVFSIQWILTVVAVFGFGWLFVAANPDLALQFREGWIQLFRELQRWFEVIPISAGEVVFCIAVGWYVVGMLRPSNRIQELKDITDAFKPDVLAGDEVAREHTLFAAYRNTIIAVSLLFAVYLTFEFSTLWFRTFPKGFHYSGYAHEGAAWLTVALALATVVLSVIFRGRLLADPRLPYLRRWAWIWSFENLLLAAAVYNRLWIYVGVNGMTRMRVVALLGMTSVVVGFLLVLWKIAHNRGFLWLLRRHILTVALAAYLYLVSPVDWLVYSYNVHRILGGDSAPAVQITEHWMTPEGILALSPLWDCPDTIVREGVRSLLISQAQTAAADNESASRDWTRYQIVNVRLAHQLSPMVSQNNKSSTELESDWQRFQEYAYQWY